MPICPNCEYEYVEGISQCPECGTELISKDEFEENLVTPEDWDIVYTTSNEYEADMLKANLDGAGIEALIVPKKDRNFPAVGDLAVIQLMVRKEDKTEAAQIIADINSNKEDQSEGNI